MKKKEKQEKIIDEKIKEKDTYVYKFDGDEKDTIKILNEIPNTNKITNEQIDKDKLTITDLINLLKDANLKDEEENKNDKNKKNKKIDIKREEDIIEKRKKDIEACVIINKKIHNSKKRYDKKNNNVEKNNEEKNENDTNTADKKNNNIISSFIYFCKKDDANKLLSGNKRIYECNSYDVRIKGLKYLIAKIIFNEIILYETTNNKDEYFIDNSIMKYYNEQKEHEKNEIDVFFIYHRKKIFNTNLRNLLKNSKISFSGIMNEVLKDKYDMIKNIIDKEEITDDDKKNICQSLYFIMKFIEEKIVKQEHELEYKEEFIKSKGKLITMIFLLIFFGCSFNLNTKPLENNILDKGRNMELDFYFDDYNLAIEIDGKHHEDKEQKERDLIKNFLCEDQNVKLYRIDTSKNSNDNYIVNELFEKMSEFSKEKNMQINKNINKKIITEISVMFQKTYIFKVKNVNLSEIDNYNIDKDEIIKHIKEISNDEEINDIGNMVMKCINNFKIKNRVYEYNKKVNEQHNNNVLKLNNDEKNDLDVVEKTLEFKKIKKIEKVKNNACNKKVKSEPKFESDSE